MAGISNTPDCVGGLVGTSSFCMNDTAAAQATSTPTPPTVGPVIWLLCVYLAFSVALLSLLIGVGILDYKLNFRDHIVDMVVQRAIDAEQRRIARRNSTLDNAWAPPVVDEEMARGHSVAGMGPETMRHDPRDREVLNIEEIDRQNQYPGGPRYQQAQRGQPPECPLYPARTTSLPAVPAAAHIYE